MALPALMDHLKLDRASVLGSSFGGYWAQFFALRHTDRVEHLFLGNIFVTPNELFSNPLFDPALDRQAPRRQTCRPSGCSACSRRRTAN